MAVSHLHLIDRGPPNPPITPYNYKYIRWGNRGVGGTPIYYVWENGVIT